VARVPSVPVLPWRKIDLSSEERPPAPFIVGVTRSGTTLLRLMLDAHPELAIPPETHFVMDVIRAGKKNRDVQGFHDAIVDNRRWGDFDLDSGELLKRLRRLDPLDARAALRCFFDMYAERMGKARWGDKTPGYQVKMRRIHRNLPESRFIHLIRDGRDVVLSQWSKAQTPTPVEDAAKRWQQRVRLTQRLASKEPEMYMELRYEELVADPRSSLLEICEFIDLDLDPAMLRHHEGAEDRLKEIAKDLPAHDGANQLDAETRMSAHEMAVRPPSKERTEVWRREMSEEDLAVFERVAGETLSALGYPLSSA
jgi:hypothetical protein